ncbi:MAG TPA: hypothetical protein VEH30_06915 [Terriglobales bacterium]|nr:hypothetical protein [Terriglobales bacterium]
MTKKKLFIPTLCLGWLVAGTAVAQNDSPQPTSNFNHGAQASAPANEVSRTGTIQQMVSMHTAGAPIGIHILLATSQGVIDANLGPYLTKNVQQSLTNGEEVQVFGVLQGSGDQNYLIARQLIIGGKRITIRNEYGFLVHPQSRTGSQSRQGQTDLNGGVQ